MFRENSREDWSVPASLIIETIMEHLAKQIKQHPIMFKEINLYESEQHDIEGNKLTYCSMKRVWNRLKQTAEVTSRMEDVNRYNKVAQAVAHSLKVPLENVKVRRNQNNTCANATLTGGSTASERCVASAINACQILNERLQPLREKMPNADWPSLLTAAAFSNIELQAGGTQFNTSGTPVNYFTYLAGVVETEVDALTGEFQVRRVDIMADFGESMNPTIDIGQIEGAFVMGLGAYLSENLIYDKTTGEVLNAGTWEYKPPTTKDIPIDWRIHLLPDAPNPAGVLSSKAVGEPPIGLAVGALLSIKSGIECVREELTGQKDFLPVVAPYTVEKIQQGTGITVDHLRVGGQN